MLFVLAYIPNGFGLGLQDAQVNSLTSRLDNAQTKMFLMHAIYGLGATVSPLISTEFVKSVGESVYFYFAVSLGLALFTALTLVVVFKFRTEDQIVGRRGENEREEGVEEVGAVRKEQEESSGDKMKRIMKTPAVHFLAFYTMIYVGVEVTIGGWAVSRPSPSPLMILSLTGLVRPHSSWTNEAATIVPDTSRQVTSLDSPLAESSLFLSPIG